MPGSFTRAFKYACVYSTVVRGGREYSTVVRGGREYSTVA